MKKNLLFLAAAAITLASCSSDETTAVNESDAISFRPLVNNVTRAANSTGVKSAFETDDVINVYANFYDASETSNSKYFQDNFTKQDGSSFTSTVKYYWPAFDTDDKLTFTAIWGATQREGYPGQIESMEIPGNKDILVARHEATAKEAAPTLNFRHALSQVILKVKNTNPSLKITITDFEIGYVDKTGAFDFDRTSASGATDTQETSVNGEAGTVTTGATMIPASKWLNTAATAPSSKYSQTLASDVVFTATNGGTSDNEVVTLGSPWILLPQTQSKATEYVDDDATATVTSSTASDLSGAYFGIKMTIESYNGSSTTGTLVSERWCCWPIAITWNPGYKYTYTINVGDGGYEPADVDGTAGLDPVLGDVIVFDADCTIDNWIVSDAIVAFP